MWVYSVVLSIHKNKLIRLKTSLGEKLQQKLAYLISYLIFLAFPLFLMLFSTFPKGPVISQLDHVVFIFQIYYFNPSFLQLHTPFPLHCNVVHLLT